MAQRRCFAIYRQAAAGRGASDFQDSRFSRMMPGFCGFCSSDAPSGFCRRSALRADIASRNDAQFYVAECRQRDEPRSLFVMSAYATPTAA